MKIKYINILYILFLTGFLLLISCGGDDPIVPEPNPDGDDRYSEEFYGEPFDKVPALNDIVMYEANQRVFASLNSFKAITNRLDEIKALGVNVLWLMPVTEQGELKAFGSPYCVKNYKKTEPEYGSLNELRTLVKEAHNRGMAVIIDWVANHTSWDNTWLEQHNDWYTKDAYGNVGSPEGTNWTDVVDLNYSNRSLRNEMIDCMAYWIKEANVDGFRCDAADWVPSDFWKEAITELRGLEKGREIIMLAEGTNADNLKAGFDLDYGWNFCDVLEGLFNNTKSVANLYASHTGESSQIPSGTQKLRFSTNHDRASEYSPITKYKSKEGAMAAYVISCTMGGVPLIYSSQEVAYASTINFFQYVNVGWNSNPDVLEEYKTLMNVYNQNQALKTGGLETFESKDIVNFYRASSQNEVYVAVNVRNSSRTLTVPDKFIGTKWTNTIINTSVTLDESIDMQAFEYLILSK